MLIRRCIPPLLIGPPIEYADSAALFATDWVQSQTQRPGFVQFLLSDDGNELISRVPSGDQVIAICTDGGPIELPV